MNNERIIVCNHDNKIHAVPLKCQMAMMWLVDQCDSINAQIESLNFLMDKTVPTPVPFVQCQVLGDVPVMQGAFIRAQGNLRRGDRTLAFEIVTNRKDAIKIYVGIGYEDYCIHSSDARDTYPLEGLFNAQEEAYSLGTSFFNSHSQSNQPQGP